MSNKRIIKIIISILVLGLIYWFGLRTDPRVEALNQALNKIGSPALQNYPYSFRVVRLEGNSAIMSTPRSYKVPVYRMIGAIYPNLAGRAQNDPVFVKAQTELAKIQSEAREIILNQPGITSVKWELDQNWLMEHNIQMN